MNQLRFLILAALAAALAGCAGPGAQKKAADDGEYEYVTPLGSNIPVRVRKGQSAANATSPSQSMSGEQATNMIHGAGGQLPGTPGAKP